MAELTFAEISKLLKYDPETGKLFWLPRPVEMFANTGLGGSATAAKRWNNCFAGKEAFLTVDGKGYLCGNIFDRQYSAARVAWLLHTGEWPSDCIDHINDAIDARLRAEKEFGYHPNHGRD